MFPSETLGTKSPIVATQQLARDKTKRKLDNKLIRTKQVGEKLERVVMKAFAQHVNTQKTY